MSLKNHKGSVRYPRLLPFFDLDCAKLLAEDECPEEYQIAD
jgi:hypothetical protein